MGRSLTAACSRQPHLQHLDRAILLVYCFRLPDPPLGCEEVVCLLLPEGRMGGYNVAHALRQ